jgi:hypothetical protein
MVGVIGSNTLGFPSVHHGLRVRRPLHPVVSGRVIHPAGRAGLRIHRCHGGLSIAVQRSL